MVYVWVRLLSALVAIRRCVDAALLLPVLLAMGLVCWQVVCHPVVGLADNGDFHWITGQMALQARDATDADRYCQQVFLEWTPAPKGWFVIHSTSQILWRFAVLLNALRLSDFFDIRVWGLLHAAIALGGLALFLYAVQKSGVPSIVRWIVGILAAVMLSDTSNVFLFNSYYLIGATLALSGWLMGAFGLLVADRQVTRWRVVLVTLVSIAFIWSKLQLAPVGFLLAGGLLWFSKLVTDRRMRIEVYAGASAVLLSALALCAYPRVSQSIRVHITSTNVFNAVFAGILDEAENPRRDLIELHMGEEFAKPEYIGKDFNTFNQAEEGRRFFEYWQHNFHNKIGFSEILTFHIRHPRRLVNLLDKSMRTLHLYTSYNLGIYEKGTPAGTTKRLFWWRSLRTALPQSVTMVWLLGALGMGAALAAALLHSSSRRKELVGAWSFVCGLAGMALSQLLLVPIVSGLPGVDKHLYPFQLLLDWLLVVLVWSVGRTLPPRAQGPGV